MNLQAAKEYIIKELLKNKNPDLHYHNQEHTMDVFNSAINIAENESLDQHDIDLVKTASLFHDSGMMRSYSDHEEASVDIIKEKLPSFGYTTGEIDAIAAMIMSTKLPQSASSKLEKIICDADLDYLGRTDFFMIAHRLRQEWYDLGVKKTTLREWYLIQVDFLGNHNYWTKTAIDLREKGKQKNLKMIREICPEY